MKYSSHFLMNCETVIPYVKEKTDFFDCDAELKAYEIGDGNINYVFRIVDIKTNKSLVVKQADRYLRSSGRPLDLHRNKIEAEILKTEGELAGEYVPVVYAYDEVMCALVMEDISAYRNLRKEMLEGNRYPKLSQWIADFLVKTLLPTTDLVMDRHIKKEKVAQFINIDLCDISEDLVFTEPYWNYKNRNVITPGEEEFVEEHLYRDEVLKGEVAYLRNRFMNEAQALIHGDLHSGSIFINEEGLKVIDPEFAFYGPMGYDAGNVIGNLIIAYVYALVRNSKDKAYLSWIEETIVESFDLWAEKFQEEYRKQVVFPLYTVPVFMREYTAGVMEDTVGYAGTEIVRRTVGDSKVEEITRVTGNERILMDRILIRCGIALIKNRSEIRNGREILERIGKAVEEEWN